MVLGYKETARLISSSDKVVDFLRDKKTGSEQGERERLTSSRSRISRRRKNSKENNWHKGTPQSNKKTVMKLRGVASRSNNVIAISCSLRGLEVRVASKRVSLRDFFKWFASKCNWSRVGFALWLDLRAWFWSKAKSSPRFICIQNPSYVPWCSWFPQLCFWLIPCGEITFNIYIYPLRMHAREVMSK